MPRYYFDLKGGDRRRDHDGIQFATDADATAHARLIANQLTSERLSNCDAPQLYVSVIHQAGREV